MSEAEPGCDGLACTRWHHTRGCCLASGVHARTVGGGLGGQPRTTPPASTSGTGRTCTRIRNAPAGAHTTRSTQATPPAPCTRTAHGAHPPLRPEPRIRPAAAPRSVCRRPGGSRCQCSAPVSTGGGHTHRAHHVGHTHAVGPQKVWVFFWFQGKTLNPKNLCISSAAAAVAAAAVGAEAAAAQRGLRGAYQLVHVGHHEEQAAAGVKHAAVRVAHDAAA